MKGSIRQIEALFGSWDIKIGAQKYLIGFYESLGFKRVGEEYLEDGIPHVYMIRKGKNEVS
jgi:ElaA protein